MSRDTGGGAPALLPRQAKKIAEFGSNAVDFKTLGIPQPEIGFSFAKENERLQQAKAGWNSAAPTHEAIEKRKSDDAAIKAKITAMRAAGYMDTRIVEIDERLEEIDFELGQIGEQRTALEERLEANNIRIEQIDAEIQDLGTEKEIIEAVDTAIETADSAQLAEDRAVADIMRAMDPEQAERCLVELEEARLNNSIAQQDMADAIERAEILGIHIESRDLRLEEIEAELETLVQERAGLVGDNESIKSDLAKLDAREEVLTAEKKSLTAEKAALEDPDFRARFEAGLVSKEEMQQVMSGESYQEFLATIEGYYNSVAETVSGVGQSISDGVDFVTNKIGGFFSSPVETTTDSKPIIVGEKNPNHLQNPFCNAMDGADTAPIYGQSNAINLNAMDRINALKTGIQTSSNNMSYPTNNI